MAIKMLYIYLKERKLKRKGRIYISKLSFSLSNYLKIDYADISKLKVSDIDILNENKMDVDLKRNFQFYKKICQLKDDDLLFPGY